MRTGLTHEQATRVSFDRRLRQDGPDAWQSADVFLPGASGAGDFWSPVAERLPNASQKTLVSWPGNRYRRARGTHDLASEQPDIVAQLIAGHLNR